MSSNGISTNGATIASRRQPPAPVRTHSESITLLNEGGSVAPSAHARHKSTMLVSGVSRGSTAHARRVGEQIGGMPTTARSQTHVAGGIPVTGSLSPPTIAAPISPPLTPIKSHDSASSGASDSAVELITYDFSRIDYELEQAKILGQGLWSTVLLADGAVMSPRQANTAPLTPPTSPGKPHQAGLSSLFAVKVPARADAVEVFRQEAKVLSRLTRLPVPFHGLDERCSSLVFDAVIGGSLENLNSRLGVMTEVGRHVELVNLFPGLADDLISGLDFIHVAGIVHADIKPANILLDISEHYSLPTPVVRARYIDFSASFRLDCADSTSNAGGTWDYMAPEQMRTQTEFSTPTFASDVWGLGITLLSLIVGGSPYTAACGNNLFMVREAIKTGDPFGFARMSPAAGKRMAACQELIDCCRQGLKKDRERRISSGDWKAWLVSQEMGG
ncbi:hypothetical protein LTR53_011044 [Teratosphaeriaceae sp. CCFEE 6253]|nr:hypothetical protein LTR53_011044 [Teratosphaeriaceae sp. CCFEE 6253]